MWGLGRILWWQVDPCWRSASTIHSLNLFPVVKWEIYSFPGAAETEYHKLGGFKPQKSIVFQSWTLEIQNEGGSEVIPPRRLDKIHFCLCLAPGDDHLSWLVAKITPLSASVIPWCSPCVFLSPIRTPVIWKRAQSTSLWPHLCKLATSATTRWPKTGSHPEVLEVRTSMYLLGRHNLVHHRGRKAMWLESVRGPKSRVSN